MCLLGGPQPKLVRATVRRGWCPLKTRSSSCLKLEPQACGGNTQKLRSSSLRDPADRGAGLEAARTTPRSDDRSAPIKRKRWCRGSSHGSARSASSAMPRRTATSRAGTPRRARREPCSVCATAARPGAPCLAKVTPCASWCGGIARTSRQTRVGDRLRRSPIGSIIATLARHARRPPSDTPSVSKKSGSESANARGKYEKRTVSSPGMSCAATKPCWFRAGLPSADQLGS